MIFPSAGNAFWDRLFGKCFFLRKKHRVFQGFCPFAFRKKKHRVFLKEFAHLQGLPSKTYRKKQWGFLRILRSEAQDLHVSNLLFFFLISSREQLLMKIPKKSKKSETNRGMKYLFQMPKNEPRIYKSEISKFKNRSHAFLQGFIFYFLNPLLGLE